VIAPGATLQFNASGTLDSGSPLAVSYAPAGAAPLTISVDLEGATPLQQFGGPSSPEAYAADGQAIGFLQGVSIGADGTITAQFSTGMTRAVGIIATATFVSPGGLDRVRGPTYAGAANPGAARSGPPRGVGRGALH